MPLHMRLDQYIVSKLEAAGTVVSRSHVQRFIKENGIIINNRRVYKPHAPVSKDEVINFNANLIEAEYAGQKIVPTVAIDPTWIIHDEEDFFVINKPAFVTSEACAGGFYLVHRLDKGTTGVLVIARSLKMQNLLQQQWKKRSVIKMYEAIVHGHISPQKGAIEGALYRSPVDRKRMVISEHPKARPARTDYEVLRYFEYADMPTSHVQFMPLTGRTHQIRVHASTLGFPIVGDALYGHEDINKKYGATHQMLHARKLIIAHPHTAKELTIEASFPNDFAELLKL